MTAVTLARGAGLDIETDGESLIVEGRADAVRRWHSWLVDHKSELLEALNAEADSCEAFAERAAIMQFDGGLHRHEAEAQAARVVQFPGGGRRRHGTASLDSRGDTP